MFACNMHDNGETSKNRKSTMVIECRLKAYAFVFLLEMHWEGLVDYFLLISFTLGNILSNVMLFGFAA